MIFRLLRGRVHHGEERLGEFVRDEAIAGALAIPGLLSFQPAIRETPTGTEVVIASTWTGIDELQAGGPSLDAPLAMPEGASMGASLLSDRHAEHYELVIGQARAMPLRKAKLRLTRIPITPGLEAAYYEAVREWADRLLDEAGLVAFTLGRRVVGRQDEVVAIQVWQDEAALRAAAGAELDQPMGAPQLSRFWAAEPAIEHFDALTAVDPRPDAPAILLADDERRYVHATPAAARLTGRPLARLLTMRIEDIGRPVDLETTTETWRQFVAEGSMAGPFVLVRPDGSEVEVRFAAKANAPWPGSHASLMAPADESGELDIDRALVESGLVARYVPS